MRTLATRYKWLVLPLALSCSFQLLATEQTKATLKKRLNDTGITGCANDANNNLPCPVTDYKGQDGDVGRDAQARKGKLKKIGGGDAGFDFTKIANDGSELPATAQLGTGKKNWACTRDNVTGLIWEVKTADGGLRDQNNTYSWYNPDKKTNGGNAGYQNNGNCTGGISCDTDAYTQAFNAQGLCGKKDWRLPALNELDSLVDYGHFRLTIDTAYFPNTLSTWFWSSSPHADNGDYAWFVSFVYGGDYGGNKKYNDSAVRLVRGGQ